MHPHIAVARPPALHPLLANQVTLNPRLITPWGAHPLLVVPLPTPWLEAVACFTVAELVTLARLHEVGAVSPPPAFAFWRQKLRFR